MYLGASGKLIAHCTFEEGQGNIHYGCWWTFTPKNELHWIQQLVHKEL